MSLFKFFLQAFLPAYKKTNITEFNPVKLIVIFCLLYEENVWIFNRFNDIQISK